MFQDDFCNKWSHLFRPLTYRQAALKIKELKFKLPSHRVYNHDLIPSTITSSDPHFIVSGVKIITTESDMKAGIISQ